MGETIEEVTACAHAMRRFLEPHWAEWHRRAGSPPGRKTLSEGTCGRSARFTALVLRMAGLEVVQKFGSPVDGDCGFHGPEGWRGHGWVELPELGVIVDVTADQFGAEPVIVTPVGDPRFCACQDRAEPFWIAERQKTADQLFGLWRGQRCRSEVKILTTWD